jgi:putative transposase
MLGASIYFSIIMIDGIHMGDHLFLIALGIDFEGKKQVLGLRVGDTENGRVVRSLLRDLLDRGLEQERARLFVIDGARALTSAIPKTFGSLAEIQRCQIHKRRNILGHLEGSLEPRRREGGQA